MTGTSLEHPWQSGPVELIRYAIFHANKKTDFDQRIAFLLLDIGTETLFKTFLQLPEDITGTKISYGKRKEASEGNFHDVVTGMKVAGGHLLKGVDLNHVLFYHELRNKLYHQGNGITIPTENVEGYIRIVVDLLNRLLKVDLSEDVLRPQIERTKLLEQKALFDEINNIKNALKKQKDELDTNILYVMEKIDPALTLPSVIRLLSDWQIKVGNKIYKWIQIGWLNNEDVEKDDDLIAIPPPEMLDELMGEAPPALISFRDKYRIKKLFLVRAAQHYETMEMLLLLITIALKLPDYESSISFDLTLFLQIEPSNPPFYLLEQNDFDTQKTCRHIISDGQRLQERLTEINSNLMEIINKEN